MTDGDTHVPPDLETMQPPAAGDSYVDPVFGTPIRRVTDATTLSEAAVVPEYSQTSAFNVDDSYMVLYWAVNGSFHLYDIEGTHLGRLPIAGGLAEPRWSRSSPEHLYSHYGNQIVRLDVGTGDSEIIETFSQYGSISFGRGQGDLSDNERVLIVGDDRYLSVYDLATRNQYSVLDLGSRGFDAAAISKDGNSYVVLFQPGLSRWNGVEQFDRDGNFMAQIQNAPAHFAMGRDVDGAAVIYITNSPSNPQQPVGCDNGVVKVTLDGAADRTCLMGLYWGMGKHLSAHGGDGWVYVSTYQNYAQPIPAPPGSTDSTKWFPYTNEIFRVRGDGSTVERLAHHRSSLDTYFRQPHATVSISGSKLLFGSDMRVDGQHAEYADTYLIDLDDTGSGGSGGEDPGDEDPGSAPSAPSQLQSTAHTDPRIDLTWTDNSDDEDAFELLRQGPGETSFQMIAYLGSDTRTYQDHAVLAAAEYCYQVVAHNSHGGSSPSNSACSTPTSLPEPPASPTGVETTAMDDPRVAVSWNDNSADEEGFEIERKGPQDSSFGMIAEVAADNVAYDDMSVTEGDEFCYRVVARNDSGSSLPSDVSCATTPEPLPDPEPEPDESVAPAMPEDQQVEQVGWRRLRLTWRDVSDNEHSFEIYRSYQGRQYRLVAQLDAGVETFDDRRLRNNREYCYRVVARNDAGFSYTDAACQVVRR